MRPLVLCSNDDGIHSSLLNQLASALEPVAEVLVVAPERQRSAGSHAITLHKPLRLTQVAPGRYSLSGTPVDCVYLGMMKLAPRPPQLVISGINDGYNLGTDVFYSGTVAAAIEGALRGSVGVALSLAHDATDPDSAIEVCRRVIAKALERREAHDPVLRNGSVLNVNLPGNGNLEVRWTRLGRRTYKDDVQERSDPRGRPYYWIGGGPTGHDDVANSDCVVTAEGFNSVTPLHLDVTDHALVATPPW
jgi:5'-nucleotidase